MEHNRVACLLGYLEFVDIESLWIDPSEGETVIGLGFPVSSGFIFGRQLGAHLQKHVVLAPDRVQRRRTVIRDGKNVQRLRP